MLTWCSRVCSRVHSSSGGGTPPVEVRTALVEEELLQWRSGVVVVSWGRPPAKWEVVYDRLGFPAKILPILSTTSPLLT